MVEADGGDGGLFSVGEVGLGAFSVFLRPAAAQVWAGDAEVWDACGGGEPPAGGIEARQ
jgi:hypothetical protein